MSQSQLHEETIFNIARKISSPEAREEYLQEACEGNSPVYERVQELLRANRDGDDLFEVPAFEATQPIQEGIGTVIGCYRLREQIGEGGMGVVFVAEQQKPIARKVALKIIKAGMDTKQVIARFEAERQALAIMDHPSIAKVIDAGSTETGRPFFVMELIRGVPITQHCDQLKLGTLQRLKLFTQVCEAVQHAHLKGIIHRDLKPANVLVTEIDGTAIPKVIDFGVAKATNQSLTEHSIYTQFSQIIGTPLYMSPEQAGMSNDDVDTRSDVYSLGVMIYELLSGKTPFEQDELRGSSFDEMRRMIREVDPPKPSVRFSTLKASESSTISERRSIDARQLHQQVRGELDLIVMKALEKDRNRRYESASALAADIDRFLSGDPVLACPPTLSYRLQKYAYRHRRLLATAGALIALLIVATVVSLNYAWQANIAKNDAIDAQKQSDKHLQAALDAVDNLLNHASNPELVQTPRVQPLVKSILADSLAFYEDFEIDENTSPAVRLRAANTRVALARLSEKLSDHDGAELLFTSAMDELNQLIEEFPDDSNFVRDLMFAETRWGWFCIHKKRDWRLAETSFARANERLQELLANEPNSESLVSHTEEVMNGWCAALYGQGKSDQADRLVLDAYEQHGLVGPPLLRLLARTNPDLAAKLWRKRLPVIRENFAKEPTVGPLAKLVQAAEFFREFDPPESIPMYEECLNASTQLIRDYPDVNNSARYLETILSGLVQARHETAQSEILRAELLSLAKEIPPGQVRAHHAISSQMRKQTDSIELLTTAIEQRPDSAAYYFQRAIAYSDAGKNDASLRDLDRAHEIAPPVDANSYMHRAEINISMSRFEDALQDMNHAIQMAPASGDNHRLRAGLYTELEQIENALADWDRYVELSKDHESLKLRGDFYREHLQDYPRAISDFTRAIELRPDGHWLYGHRARVHILLGDSDAAKADMERGFELGAVGVDGPWWISVDSVMQTGKEFQTWMFEYLERCAEASGQDSEWVWKHAELALNMGEYEKARSSLAQLKSGSSESDRYRYSYWYYDALLAAHTGEGADYHQICAEMLDLFSAAENIYARYFITWTSALKPNTTDNYHELTGLAERILEQSPEDAQFLNALGAIRYRAGDYQKARENLSSALDQQDASKTSTAYTRYFLALTLKSLGQQDEAHSELLKANEIADEELAAKPTWNRKLTLGLLRREAEAFIDASSANFEPVNQ